MESGRSARPPQREFPDAMTDAPFDALSHASSAMTDPFGRTISYLRVSVTDRCDLGS